MESRNTYADAFLVNAVLLLALSLPVSHLLARVSATQLGDCYVTRFYRDMEASTPFKQFFAANVFYYAVFAASAITAILYFVFPLKQNDKLEKRLEKIKS
ncbi:hypothetical protein MHBO_001129 [Bonamia ostreae]|uniref:Uncharacterized protein n=1 Tax=Bonamia ostreae TaxID=126728 RepID=A0ABV2AHX3_9EUKA